MASFDTAYVHIGLHKTGTTSIQQTFARHRDMLRADHGLIYPSVSSNHSVPLFSLFCDRPGEYNWNKHAGVTSPEDVARRNQAFSDSLDQDMSAGGTTLVLSGEDLGLLSRDAVSRFKRWLMPQAKRIVILAYVREPVAWATSHAQQQVRHGKTLDSLMAVDLVPRFRKRLLPWVLAFGKNSVTVSDFDVARRHAAGLLGHFAERLGLPDTVNQSIKPRLVNESLSGEAIVLLSALNALKPRVVDDRASPERDAAVDQVFARIKGERFALPPEAVARTKEASATEVIWLANIFGLQFAEPAQPRIDAPLFSSAATRDSLALLLWEASRTPTPAIVRTHAEPEPSGLQEHAALPMPRLGRAKRLPPPG